MYDPIFAKSFSRNERRRLGFAALLLCFIISLSISSTFKPRLHPLSLLGEAVNLQLSINAVEDLLIIDEAKEISEHTNEESKENPKQIEPTGTDNGNVDGNSQLSMDKPENTFLINKTNAISQTTDHGNVDGNLQLFINEQKNQRLANQMNANSQPTEKSKHSIEFKKRKEPEPLCRILEAKSDYCEIEGDIRIEANSSTIYVVTPISANSTNSWTIQPYPRKGITNVKHWTVKSLGVGDNSIIEIPKCDQSHALPALLFSVGGFSGNHFHAFADVIFPLYSTSFRFQKDVHLLASDYKPWWIAKYRAIFDQITRHQIIDINTETTKVHCYPKLVAGLLFHREFIIHPSSKASMQNFRQLLRHTYSLQRNKAIRTRKRSDRAIRPRLMIVSRKGTRILTNEDQVSRTATKLGFDVVSAEAGMSTNLSRFAEVVNSCDVMMGIHGAGLTNMLFLPDNAVLIQIVPLGGIDVFARLDFGNPAAEMKMRYLEYKIDANESSLRQQYPMDHPVIKDPISLHRKGWGIIKSVYLENQNVTINIPRFRGTLVKAFKLLRH